MPDDVQLRRHLLQAYHDSPVAMHRGRVATYEALAHHFYWRNMSETKYADIQTAFTLKLLISIIVLYKSAFMNIHSTP